MSNNDIKTINLDNDKIKIFNIIENNNFFENEPSKNPTNYNRVYCYYLDNVGLISMLVYKIIESSNICKIISFNTNIPYRNHGYGNKLLSLSIEDIKTTYPNITEIRLFATSKAISIYEKNGFKSYANPATLKLEIKKTK